MYKVSGEKVKAITGKLGWQDPKIFLRTPGSVSDEVCAWKGNATGDTVNWYAYGFLAPQSSCIWANEFAPLWFRNRLEYGAYGELPVARILAKCSRGAQGWLDNESAAAAEMAAFVPAMRYTMAPACLLKDSTVVKKISKEKLVLMARACLRIELILPFPFAQRDYQRMSRMGGAYVLVRRTTCNASDWFAYEDVPMRGGERLVNATGDINIASMLQADEWVGDCPGANDKDRGGDLDFWFREHAAGPPRELPQTCGIL